jgi:hypothetical protein
MYLVHARPIDKRTADTVSQTSGRMMRQDTVHSGGLELRKAPRRSSDLLTMAEAALLQADGDEHGAGIWGIHAS